MLPPPSPSQPASPAAPSPEPERQPAGLIVLAVALAVLLSAVGLVWYLNARESDDGGWPSRPSTPSLEHVSAASHAATTPT